MGTVRARSWAPTKGERTGKTLIPLEVTAETSLQWATLTVTTAKRCGSWAEAPAVAADSEQGAPF